MVARYSFYGLLRPHLREHRNESSRDRHRTTRPVPVATALGPRARIKAPSFAVRATGPTFPTGGRGPCGHRRKGSMVPSGFSTRSIRN